MAERTARCPIGSALFITALFSCLGGGCGGTRVAHLSQASSCSVGEHPLPACASVGHGRVFTVSDIYRKRPAEKVTVRGRLVIGAQCAQDCYGGLFPALASEGVQTAAPSRGPLLVLTSSKNSAEGRPFSETIYDLRFPGHCKRRYDQYCCGLEIAGQDVLVSGYAIAPPPVSVNKSGGAGSQSCSSVADWEMLSLPNRESPKCSLIADWRANLDEVWGFAADFVCALPDSAE